MREGQPRSKGVPCPRKGGNSMDEGEDPTRPRQLSARVHARCEHLVRETSQRHIEIQRRATDQPVVISRFTVELTDRWEDLGSTQLTSPILPAPGLAGKVAQHPCGTLPTRGHWRSPAQ